MSLRSKIVFILLMVMVSYAGADFAIQKMTVSKGFLALEKEEAEKDVSRIAEAVQREVNALHQLCLDWSAWDEMVEFVEKPSPSFVKANLGRATLSNSGIDLLFICDVTGKVVWNAIVDPDTNKAVALRDFPTGQLLPTHPFLAVKRNGDTAHGLFLTEYKPMLVSARPILTSERQGPERGTVILGRFLSDSLEQTLTKQTRVDFDFWQMDSRHPLPPDVDRIRDELTASAHAVIKAPSDSTIHAFRTIDDFRGRPDFLIRANVARRISEAGSVSVRYALISTLAAGLIVLLALMGLLQRTVLTPLSVLTRHAVSIGKLENFRAKLNLKRNDELGVLSREFDQMMAKLEEARAALVEAARTAGKSEIATGILHNVGNLLNSVNVSANVLVQKTSSMRVSDLEALSKILAEHAQSLSEFIASDPRGKHVQPALSALTQHFGTQQKGILTELGSLTDGVAHIRELVKSQQSFAVQAVLEEPTDVPETVRKAIALTNKATANDKDLEIVHAYGAVPEILVDKHKLLEILVNLVQNARQAMEMAEGKAKKLTIAIESVAGERLRISITDTGVGIAPESLTKIFSLGFTTKPQGHGFGLHAAVNAATEMGGGLSARSEGLGHGATFVLEIPQNQKARAAAAGVP